MNADHFQSTLEATCLGVFRTWLHVGKIAADLPQAAPPVYKTLGQFVSAHAVQSPGWEKTLVRDFLAATSPDGTVRDTLRAFLARSVPWLVNTDLELAEPATVAFGSAIHVERTRELASRLEIALVTTSFGVKNAADHALVRAANALGPKRCSTIVVGSGDRGYLNWLTGVRARGQRLECISRQHQLCKDAQAGYDIVYQMHAKRMTVPSPADLRVAAVDCIPELETGPVDVKRATSLMRACRIAPKHTPGYVFFARHAEVFRLAGDGREVGLA